jgi:hypothetical protein
MMYIREQRALNDKEARSLNLAIASAKREIAAVRKRILIAGPIIIVALWVLTLLATRRFIAPTICWGLIGTLICIWAWADAVRPHRKRITDNEDAISNGRVDEVRISTEAMVEFQEIEDEGACYAFQVEQDKIVFVCGQDYYSGAKFPSTDFSIVSVYGRNGDLVQLLIEKRGKKLQPIRTVSAELKAHLQIPEHLEMVSGKLDDVERILKSTQSGSRGFFSPSPHTTRHAGPHRAVR